MIALAVPFRYRVTRAAEGWPIILGRYGRLEWHDGTALAVYTDRPRIFARAWALPWVQRWQVGDQEARGLFPVEAFPAVANLIQARRRRTLSSAATRQKGASTAYRTTSALEDRLAHLDRLFPYRAVLRDSYSGASGITAHSTT